MSSTVNRIARLVEAMNDQRTLVELVENNLKHAKADLRRMEEEDLPELMREYGIDRVTLTDGTTVVVDDEIDCHISEERRPAAHAWLVEHGFAGLIKTQVVVEYERGRFEAAQRLADEVAAVENVPTSVVERIHPGTLKAFIKEQMSQGVTVPFDLFGVRPYSRAKVRVKK